MVNLVLRDSSVMSLKGKSFKYVGYLNKGDIVRIKPQKLGEKKWK